MALGPWLGWPTSANPHPTVALGKDRSMEIMQSSRPDDDFKPSTVGQLEAEKQVKADGAKTTSLDLDMATLTLDTAPRGSAKPDSRPAVKEERVPALGDEEDQQGGTIDGLTDIGGQCASINADGHSGPDLEDEAKKNSGSLQNHCRTMTFPPTMISFCLRACGRQEQNGRVRLKQASKMRNASFVVST